MPHTHNESLSYSLTIDVKYPLIITSGQNKNSALKSGMSRALPSLHFDVRSKHIPATKTPRVRAWRSHKQDRNLSTQGHTTAAFPSSSSTAKCFGSCRETAWSHITLSRIGNLLCWDRVPACPLLSVKVQAGASIGNHKGVQAASAHEIT